MSRKKAVFPETTQLIKALQYSLRSRKFSTHSVWENLLLGVVYVIILAILPLAVLSDLFSFFVCRTTTTRMSVSSDSMGLK